MKKQKSLNSLSKSLENQKDAVVLSSEGKSNQYFCGMGGYASDYGGAGEPPGQPHPKD